jgi:hypothetical protein
MIEKTLAVCFMYVPSRNHDEETTRILLERSIDEI